MKKILKLYLNKEKDKAKMGKQVIKDWKPIYKIAEVSGVFLGGIMLVLIFRGGFDVMETWLLRMLIDAAKENQAS